MSSETTRSWRRFSHMDWDELRTRAGQGFAKRWDTLLYRLGTDFYEKRDRCFQGAHPHFFFSPEELPEIIALLRARPPEEAERIEERAGRLYQHRFDLLGYSDLDYGEPINWHLDLIHDKCAPRKPWYRIPFLDFNTVGDSKITWELNRHQHWVTLAKAYWLTGDERFAAEVCRHWYHWQQENPYPIRIIWASSLE